jgi:lysophospholipase L1-like esterase
MRTLNVGVEICPMKLLTFLAISIVLIGCSAHHREATEVSIMTNHAPIQPGPVVYVALGDSTGAGVGAREGGYVARLFKRILKLRPGSQLTNLCISGATTSDVMRMQLDQAVTVKPQLVTVGVGINDIGHGVSMEQFSTNYEEILRTLRHKTDAAIVVTNIPDISSAPSLPPSIRTEYQNTIMRFNQRLEEVATRYGVVIFDIYRGTQKELPSHPEYFSADGFHPSDQGYELWANEMWETIKLVIGVRHIARLR